MGLLLYRDVSVMYYLSSKKTKGADQPVQVFSCGSNDDIYSLQN